MRSLSLATVFATLIVPVCNAQETRDFKNWYAGWSVQKAVNDSQLVLVAKVTHVGKVKVVEGAKTDKYFREFRFQPIEQIKGIYSRGELVMSASDLGCSSSTGAAANDIREGQLRILMLSQSNPLSFGLGDVRSFGCVSAPNSKNFRQSVPLLTGKDDPIIQMFKTMCRLANVRSRQARAELLVEALNAVEGPAVIPLLTAIRRDAMWAAANQDVVDPLVRLSGDGRKPIRAEAIRTIATILSWSFNVDLPTDLLGQAVRDSLKDKHQPTSDRVLAVQALKNLKGDNDWRTELILEIFRGARSYQERFAAAEVLGELEDEVAFETLAAEFEVMPLDTYPKNESKMAQALLKINPKVTTQLVKDRFRESLAAGQPVSVEVKLFTEFQIRDAIDELMIAMQTPDFSGKNELITALGELRAEEAVPELTALLESWPKTVMYSKQALLKIGTREAAIALRPHLKTETDLTSKLRIAALLAKYGFDDGYSLAIEHLADRTEVSLLAAEVLGAIGAERAEKQLKPILENNPDPQWYAAALAGLLAVENEEARTALAKILEDGRHPNIVKAAEFAHLAKNEFVLPLLTKHIESRNGKLALAALRAHAKIIRQALRIAKAGTSARRSSVVKPVSFSLQNQDHQDELLETLQRVLADSYIDRRIRGEALSVLELFSTEESSDTLLALLDRTELESSKIVLRIEQLVRERGVQVQGSH